MFQFNGIPVILSEHMNMTETVVVHIYRNFRPGYRRGKDKRLRKLVYSKWITRPSGNALFVNGTAVFHPDVYYEMVEKMEMNRDLLAENLGVVL